MFQWKAQQPKKCFQILKRTQIMWEPWSDADPESVGPEWSLKVCISSKFRPPPTPGCHCCWPRDHTPGNEDLEDLNSTAGLSQPVSPPVKWTKILLNSVSSLMRSGDQRRLVHVKSVSRLSIFKDSLSQQGEDKWSHENKAASQSLSTLIHISPLKCVPSLIFRGFGFN